MKYKSEDCIYSRAQVVARRIEEIYRTALKGSGVTESQLSIMVLLNESDSTLQSQIGKRLHLERSTVSRNLQRLLLKFLIIKSGPAARPSIVLTEKGKKKMKTLLPIWEEAMRQSAELLGKEGQQALELLESKFH